MNNKIKGILLILPYVVMTIAFFGFLYINDSEQFKIVGTGAAVMLLALLAGAFAIFGVKKILEKDRENKQ